MRSTESVQSHPPLLSSDRPTVHRIHIPSHLITSHLRITLILPPTYQRPCHALHAMTLPALHC